MTLVQLVNDLRGAMTFQEAQERLLAVLERLEAEDPGEGSVQRTARALVTQVYNKVSGFVCIRQADVADFGFLDVDIEHCYALDQPLPGDLRSLMTRVSNALGDAGLSYGITLDPKKEKWLYDYAKDPSFLVPAVLGLGAVWILVAAFLLAPYLGLLRRD